MRFELYLVLLILNSYYVDRHTLFEFMYQITSMNVNRCIFEVSAVSNVRRGVRVWDEKGGGRGVA